MAPKNEFKSEAGAICTAGKIVSCYVANNTVDQSELPSLLQSVYAVLVGLSTDGLDYVANREPAVPINKSVTPHHIVCLEDGKKLKMLKRYLRTHYDLSPDEYKRKWGLPADYPMTAPSYAKKRSDLAKQIGLGTTATKRRSPKTARRKRGATKGKRSAA
ncbi:MucR family transcriptional regulator [Hyphococcus sp.]|uniref:MucR family transcriptional regulator n=1 Tax=Hyphococcus sp. TaxID=2038636 RepID=UPI0020800CF8|nr:MAG: hypothetical protein DHS20C04_18130 [Marinicaulis sp.]